MTVNRESQDYVDAHPDAVAMVTRAILGRGTSYAEMTEVVPGTCFNARVTPAWSSFHGPVITVQLAFGDGGGTNVLISVESRGYVFGIGDIFDLCNGYIKSFQLELQAELAQQLRDS